jgi:hypothetical protein
MIVTLDFSDLAPSKDRCLSGKLPTTAQAYFDAFSSLFFWLLFLLAGENSPWDGTQAFSPRSLWDVTLQGLPPFCLAVQLEALALPFPAASSSAFLPAEHWTSPFHSFQSILDYQSLVEAVTKLANMVLIHGKSIAPCSQIHTFKFPFNLKTDFKIQFDSPKFFTLSLIVTPFIVMYKAY